MGSAGLALSFADLVDAGFLELHTEVGCGMRMGEPFSSRAHHVSDCDVKKLEGLIHSFGEPVYNAALAALMAGHAVKGTTSPNPSVGACIIPDGFQTGDRAFVGATSPAGGDHAEVGALKAAGSLAQGGSAVVTLEPCNHVGRTGPCAQALVEAGVRRVFFMAKDPHAIASGGAQYLEAHGVEVHFLDIQPTALVPWLKSMEQGRVSVTAKWAHTLDGFIAAVDGTSKWITGEQAREFVHWDRSHRDAIVVGTGTALADNPQLTARVERRGGVQHQPLRIVVGSRELPSSSHLASALISPEEFECGAGQAMQFSSLDQALETLWALGLRDVLVEGGSGLFSSLFAADLVDFVHDYTAPALLGGGTPLFATPLAESMEDIVRLRPLSCVNLGEDQLKVMEIPRP